MTVRLAVLLLPVVAAAATAQELTPRFYAPAPTGANIMVLSYGRSTGELLFDPALPFDDVNAAINNSTLLYGRTFGLLGRSANVAVGVPYVWGEIDGFVEGEFRQITRSGLGDVRAQLTLNVLGGPALEIGKIMSGGCVPVPIFSACTRERSMPSVLEHSKSPRAVEATCG